MTNLINTFSQTTKIKMEVIKNAIARRIAVGKSLTNAYFVNTGQPLNNIEAVAQNLKYASS